VLATRLLGAGHDGVAVWGPTGLWWVSRQIADRYRAVAIISSDRVREAYISTHRGRWKRMTQRSLQTPYAEFAASYIAALREGYQFGDDPPLGADAIDGIEAEFSAHLAAVTRQGALHVFADGSSLPLSPFSLFWFIEDGREFLGSLHLRHELANDYARLIAGHVRYGVRPSRRRQGIGTEMLTAARIHAQALGHPSILVVCRESNVASRLLIEKCGGVFERTVTDPYGEGPKRRYWITL
jgi:predicted acetyltransferase